MYILENSVLYKAFGTEVTGGLASSVLQIIFRAIHDATGIITFEMK